jgi:hypothetical protein
VLQTQVNEACRKRPHRVAFYSVDCRGTCGSLFVDLQRHSFTSKKAGDDKAAQQDISFPSLQEALNVPWSSFNKRTSKLLFALRSGCQTLTNLKLFVTIGLLSSKVYAFEALCLVSLFFFICSYLDLFLFSNLSFYALFSSLLVFSFSFRFC